jgi:hypothetical protein
MTEIFQPTRPCVLSEGSRRNSRSWQPPAQRRLRGTFHLHLRYTGVSRFAYLPRGSSDSSATFCQTKRRHIHENSRFSRQNLIVEGITRCGVTRQKRKEIRVNSTERSFPTSFVPISLFQCPWTDRRTRYYRTCAPILLDAKWPHRSTSHWTLTAAGVQWEVDDIAAIAAAAPACASVRCLQTALVFVKFRAACPQRVAVERRS